MPDLFLYGTLRHVPLLNVVAGETVEPAQITPASLPDHVVRCAQEGDFPMLLAEPGQIAHGLLVTGLSDTARGRIAFYEAGFDFTIEVKQLEGGAKADAFVPHPRWTPGAMWDFVRWAETDAEVSTEAAHEAMTFFGNDTPQALAAAFPRIRVRAQSRLNAAGARHGAGVLDGRVEIKAQRRLHRGFYALDDIRFSHQTFSGQMSDPVDRYVFVTTDAALVLPYDPVSDRVLVVEQVRVGPIARGDAIRWQMEPVAGLIDPGETPQTTARREAMEEAGIEIGALHKVAEGYSSPGGSTDFHYLYVGICALPARGTHTGGLAEEGEDIRAHVLGFDELMALAEDQRLANTPLALATYWLAHHRSGLRSG